MGTPAAWVIFIALSAFGYWIGGAWGFVGFFLLACAIVGGGD